ncbi:hypothetical protein [Saccharopolyspora sp. ASAGF58]|uniref:hypothetical protein n=1 Tax=Saccharopolyspora sp. ASAGF58 TaxID=2719023 RepID=UPI0014400B92|nr:hypothetical protein [Saccharopolyspora sp. ASAGF58]QIZ37387.1 hypothetical protein FDZ84_25820 [Saccharopolyspora sp. ASAGF58]
MPNLRRQPYPPQHYPALPPHYPVPPPQPYFFQRKRWQEQAKRVVLTVVAPWMAARFLLKPKTGERVRDRKLMLLASLRAVFVTLVVAAVVGFRRTGGVLVGSLEVFAHIWLPAAVLVPVLFVGLLVTTRSGQRSRLLPGALRMLWRLLLGAVCLSLSLLVLGQIADESPLVERGTLRIVEDGRVTDRYYETTRDGDGNLITRFDNGDRVFSDEEEGNALIESVGALISYVWFPIFGCCAVYWAARSGLWLGEVHPLLGLMGSVVLMLLVTGQGVAELGSAGTLLLVLVGCGVVGTLVLAVFEFRRARAVGFRVRSGPEPVQQDCGAASPDAPTLPFGLRALDQLPETGGNAGVSAQYRQRAGRIAAGAGNAVAVVGRGIARPFGPIVRFVRRKRVARQVDAAKPRMFAVVVFPWLTARYLFKPEVGPLHRDRLLDRLGFWRTVAGLGVVVATTIRFRGPSDLFWDLVGKGYATIGLAVFIAPLPILMALDARRNGYGPQLWPGFVRMIKRAALALIVIPLPLGIIVGVVLLAFLAAWLTFVVALPVILLGVVALLWCVPFVVCTFFWAVRTSVWMSEVNPLLAPLAGTAFAVSISIQELVGGDTRNVPPALWLTLNIFGLITTVLLGTAEYRHAKALGYRLLRFQEAVAAPVDPPRPSSGFVRPVLRDLGRLAREHYHYIRQYDR